MSTLTSPAATTTSRVLLALLLAFATTVATAQDRPRGGAQPPADHPQTEQRPSDQRQADQRQAAPGPGVLRLLPGDSVTQHTIEIAGRKLDYTATAGTLSLYDQTGERSAAIYYTAYVAKGGEANRPLTFAFNGIGARSRAPVSPMN